MTSCLLIATRNTHKVAEIQAILGNRFQYATLRDFPQAPVIEETGDTFAANARLKAEALAQWLAQNQDPIDIQPPRPAWVLADDSGLEVDALAGAPGVHSARFASEESGLTGNAPDDANNAKLLRLLAAIPKEARSARFRCVLALTPVPTTPPWGTRLFHGTCEGSIGFIQRGEQGFGYDPLFIPVGFDQTLAQLGETTKNQISHRSAALAALNAALPNLLR